MYTRAPQGLPGVSEYEEELTDAVFGDMVVKGDVAKWADNIYTGGHDEESFLKNIREICSRMKESDLRAAPKKTIIGIKETTVMGWHWKEGSLSPTVHKLNPLAVCEKPECKGTKEFPGRNEIS